MITFKKLSKILYFPSLKFQLTYSITDSLSPLFKLLKVHFKPNFPMGMSTTVFIYPSDIQVSLGKRLSASFKPYAIFLESSVKIYITCVYKVYMKVTQGWWVS